MPAHDALARLRLQPASAFSATVATGAEPGAEVTWASNPLKFITTLGVGIAVGYSIEHFAHKCDGPKESSFSHG
jgi:hypothetical protein